MCTCVCGWWCWGHICVLIFFSLLLACSRQGGSLIMFLVVFTNVSFIKHQQPWERQHPSAKVEVIIALNHLAVYLCGWLSEAKGGRPPVSPRGRRGCHCPPLLPLPLCHSYSSTYCSLLLLLLSFFLSFLLTKVSHVVVTISHVSCIFLRVCQIWKCGKFKRSHFISFFFRRRWEFPHVETKRGTWKSREICFSHAITTFSLWLAFFTGELKF